MTQREFESRHAAFWQALNDGLQRRDPRPSVDAERLDFPKRYRMLCQQLAIARGRLYGLELIERLEALAQRCHDQLYGGSRSLSRGLVDFLLVHFPIAIRARGREVLCALLLFVGPLVLVLGLASDYPELVHATLGPAGMSSLEQMYEPSATPFQSDRPPGHDVLMFGYYIEHNIGIGFSCFATGLLFGLGSVVLLIYNGLSIGAAAAYIDQLGYGTTFYSFVIGHGAFELPAIVLMGAAGLALGRSLLEPGDYRRVDALRIAARDVLPIVLGATAMLTIAAILEAFFSPRASIPVEVKLAIGSALWVLVVLHWMIAGRGRAA